MLSCSDGSALAGEQLAGSAPQALAWVALEQSGPWGAKAFTESHLDVDLGRAIEAAAAGHQTRAVLIRRPGRHPDKHAHTDTDPRHLLMAFTHPRGTWLVEGTIDSPDDLLRLDWVALERGDLDGVRRSLPGLAPSGRPHLLVCTNGTRDVCCATKGRSVAAGIAAQRREHVWEVTHTSGHRFAPTAVLLPAGTLHGRLDATTASDVLLAAERGETVIDGSRGRSTWPAPAQVAELAVRELTGECSLSAFEVIGHESAAEYGWITTVTHLDGRTWQVATTSEETTVDRAESCSKTLRSLRRYATTVETRVAAR